MSDWDGQAENGSILVSGGTQAGNTTLRALPGRERARLLIRYPQAGALTCADAASSRGVGADDRVDI
jgi:hypothetical protein